MDILILGSGGREHALAWKISQSDLCQNLYLAPGNGGTSNCATNVKLDPNDFEKLSAWIIDNEINMLIVGPEMPLVEGIVDHIRKEGRLDNLLIIGPDQKGAQLEGSKSFAKNFMENYSIPTADYVKYSSKDLAQAQRYLTTCNMPIVLKADGLAAGKGVLICATLEEAQAELGKMLSGKFGKASETVVIEEFLRGREFSVFALTDGKTYKLLPVAKDYKRIGEGDTGPNTGGMGSVSPVSFVDEMLMEKVEERIVKPTIRGIRESGFDYRGILFFGLIERNGEPYVIEYNCRLGDPETQVVLPRIQSDLLTHFVNLCEGKLEDEEIDITEDSAATVILASGGYPGEYEKHKHINGLNNLSDCIAFHAGTLYKDNQILTNGGRVLAITSVADTVHRALNNCYGSLSSIRFEKQYYRKDIGFDV